MQLLKLNALSMYNEQVINIIIYENEKKYLKQNHFKVR